MEGTLKRDVLGVTWQETTESGAHGDELMQEARSSCIPEVSGRLQGRDREARAECPLASLSMPHSFGPHGT